MPSERRRAGRFETLGAWLHIWTPGRNVEVPPVPWRRLLVFGVPALALLVGGAWLVVDDASESRREREAIAERERARHLAAERERLSEEQRLRVERVRPGAKPALVEALERAILADARGRVRRGDLARPVQRVDCEPFPRTAPRRAAELDPSRRSGRYHCLAVNRDIVGTGEGSIGYPFFARIHYRDGRLAWCKINPIPGEQALPDPRTVETLPAGCT